MNSKPTHVKPAMYTMMYWHLKKIAEKHGYNLLIHGSIHRDLDLVAVPWIDTPRAELEMIRDIDIYLNGSVQYGKNVSEFDANHYCIKKMPGGRNAYIINMNRGDKTGEWKIFEDEQYYLDISVTPLKSKSE